MSEMTLGKRIMQHRKRLGLTQEQLAERIGVSAQAVSKWENDLSCPDISLLPVLAEIFGITVDELLGKEEPAKVHEAEVVGDKPERQMEYSLHLKRWEGIWFAVYILCIGGLLLLTALKPELGVSWWTVLWTTALLIGGLAGMVHHPSFFPLAVTLAGAYFLLTEFGVWKVTLGWSLVIPAFLLLWGVSLMIDVIFGKKRKRRRGESPESTAHYYACECENGWLKCVARFSDRTFKVATEQFRGGEIETRFGDYRFDFSGCAAVAPDCRLTLKNSFGDVTLKIPARFQVQVDRQNNAFSADVNVSGQPLETPEGTIFLETEISFGDLTICYI